MADDSHLYAMIMAGGSGTRLWPMSRIALPKQLIPFIRGQSLLQIAAEHLEGVIPMDRRMICTAEAYRPLIRKGLPQFANDQILGEPVPRDTLNAIALTAVALQKRDPDAIFAVLTADHIIEPLDEFRRKLKLGFQLVLDDPYRFVTFSILPSSPATGYGYVERGEAIAGTNGAYLAKRFVEKPNAKKAQEYVDAGTFGWNSGMFVFSASTFLNVLARFKPRSHAGMMKIQEAWGTSQQGEVVKKVYPNLPKISVDFAIMEPACEDEEITVCTVPMGIWWQDVGSWPTYGETLSADPSRNATNTNTIHLDSRNILTVSDDPEHTIATLGCDDLIIIHTKDVTLVCPRSESERLKDLVEKADESLR